MDDDFLNFEDFAASLKDEAGNQQPVKEEPTTDVQHKTKKGAKRKMKAAPPTDPNSKLKILLPEWFMPPPQPHAEPVEIPSAPSVSNWEEHKTAWSHWQDQAHCHYARGEYEQALDKCRACLATAQPMPREVRMMVLDAMARSLARLGRHADSLELLEELVGKLDFEKKKDPGIGRLLGEALCCCGRRPEGIESFKQSVAAAGSHNTQTWQQLARAFLEGSSTSDQAMGKMCLMKILDMIAINMSSKRCPFSQTGYAKVLLEARQRLAQLQNQKQEEQEEQEEAEGESGSQATNDSGDRDALMEHVEDHHREFCLEYFPERFRNQVEHSAMEDNEEEDVADDNNFSAVSQM